MLPCDLRDGHEIGLFEQCPRGVVGIAQDEHLGLGGDPLLEVVDAHLECIFLFQGDKDRNPSGQSNSGFVADPTGVTQQDFLSLIYQRKEGHEQGLL